MPVPSDIVVKQLMQRRAELIGYAWIVVGDADAAEDVFQEVSVAAIRKCDEIADADHLLGWLYTAVRLEGLKARRERSRNRQLLSSEALEVLEHASAASVGPDESDHLAALRECIQQLQGGPREIVELRYGQNLKPADIAQRTGKKVQTIYKTITRAHGALRECVQRRLTSEGGLS